MTFPMLAEEFNTKGGFGVYGKLAFEPLEQLFEEANEELDNGTYGPWYDPHGRFGTHKVAAARKALRQVMNEAVMDPDSEPFDLDGHLYQFKPDGTGTNTTFRVWQIDNDGTFKGNYHLDSARFLMYGFYQDDRSWSWRTNCRTMSSTMKLKLVSGSKVIFGPMAQFVVIAVR